MNCKSILTAVVSLVFAGILHAAPPDDVCDPLKEATKGLYGLCVAFCVAHPPGESGIFQLSTPQLQILESYNRKKTPQDPHMPCFQGCPCFSVEEAEFIAVHPYFRGCHDYTDEEAGSLTYERKQLIHLAGDRDETGRPQTYGSVGTAVPVPDLELPPWDLLCDLNYHVDDPYQNIGRSWIGDYFNSLDQRKIEDCHSVIEHVADKFQLPCETAPECTVRVVIDSMVRDDMSIDINGRLVNHPPEYCVNQDPIASIDWYWGDGTLDTFDMMPDGYVYPFPNSHTYTENLGFGIRILAYNAEGDFIGGASRIVILW